MVTARQFDRVRRRAHHSISNTQAKKSTVPKIGNKSSKPRRHKPPRIMTHSSTRVVKLGYINVDGLDVVAAGGLENVLTR